MQISSKLLIRTAIIVLGMLLALSVFVAVNSQSAKALDATQWDHVRGYINSYFSSEATGGNEAGLIYGKDALMQNLGGNTGTGADPSLLSSYAGEGDNMANKPVIIDNLMTNPSGIVPGTEFRCNWNTDGSCFGSPAIAMVKGQVDAHAAAGFSTDIIDYCATSHTASPTTAGFGIIAQTGALSSGPVPKVYELYYSRQGWANTYANPAAGANPVAAPEAPGGGFGTPTIPTNPSFCTGTDAQVVECAANWAISSTGGNVGNGTSSLTDMTGAGQTIDVRPGSIMTLSTAGRNVQAPLDMVFSSAGLAQYVDPTKTTLVASASQHGGQAAMGFKMLGYTTVTGGYINSGVYRWSSSATPYTLFVPTVAYPLKSVTNPVTGPGVLVDTNGAVCSGPCAAPVISGPSAIATGFTTADVSRTVDKPATTKIDLTGSDSSVVHVNDTVLHATNTEHLTGLTGGVTYTGTLTVYDSNAVSSSTPISFTTPTPCTPAKPALSLAAPSARWASFADYTARIVTVDWTINNTGTNNAANVQITGGTNSAPVTFADTLPTAGIAINAGGSGTISVRYNVPIGVLGWHASITASAVDPCNNASYTYPV